MAESWVSTGKGIKGDWGFTLENDNGYGGYPTMYIISAKDGQKLTEIKLYTSKFQNPYTGFYYLESGKSVPAGTVTSYNTITMTLIVNGVRSNTVTLPDSFEIMQPAGSGYTNYDVYANTQHTETFTFGSNGVIINAMQVVYLELTGCNNNNGIIIRSGTNGYHPQGIAQIFDVPLGPSSISIEGASGKWITDLSGASIGNGVLKSSSTTFKVTPNPSNSEITNAKFTGNQIYTKSSYNYNNDTITTTAKRNNIDYNTKETTTLSVNGGAQANFTVNFYEKIKVNKGTTSLDLNIRTASNKSYTISGYNPQTSDAKGRRLFLSLNNGKTYTDKGSFSNNGQTLPVGNFLTLDSNNSNIFKIANENTWHKLRWRFYNSAVQTKDCNLNENSYKKDIITDIRWSITPNMISQFSFDWLDINGNILSDDPPDIIIPEFDAPLIGNLKYSNVAITGGYCRGFRIQYIDNLNTVVYTDYINATVNSSTGIASTSGRILNAAKLNNLPYGKELTIKITMYFYFNDSTTTRYYGSTYTLKQKLIRIREEDLYPTLIFPIVNQQSPYTPMMLEDVERFGYELSDVVVNNQELFDTDFGLLVDGKEVNFNTAQEYISSTGITKHLVYDIGKYVKDNKLYLSELTVLPYIDVYYGKTYIKRITVKGGNDKTPNAVIVTTLDSMWNRPVAQSGEYTTYFDYDRFMQFINKYRALYNNQLFNVPTDKRGDIINTDFWLDIANKLDIYATNMQNWATNTINFIVLWALPEFKHEKGEYITNNNLYQNYYDLLIQHSGYDSFATHDYLNENNYTHNELGTHTHDEITNKDGI